MISQHLSASSVKTDQKLFGGSVHKSSPVLLKAGSLNMLYENGALRYISSGKTELVRMICSALRDRKWLTIQPAISDEKFDIKPDSFKINYRSHYLSGDINYVASYQITGDSDDSLTFIMEGKAVTSFKKNRIGFCILHPAAECTGKPCTVIHSNESAEEIFFPEYISPDQPFRDIRAMQWKINGLDCRLDFEGDIFETEDQRNWTDASYKTYCTPLDRPFPVIINKGERINQKVRLKVDGSIQKETDEADIINLTLYPGEIMRVPAFGICHSSRPQPLTDNEISILKQLKFDHYRIDLYLFENDWKGKADLAVNEAEKLGYPLELALFFGDNASEQCAVLIDWLSGKDMKISVIDIYDKSAYSTPDLLTDTLAPLFRNAFPGVNIACGTNANFAQLNRNRPGSVRNDYICYSVHPQEHASDNATLVENLKAQEYTVHSAGKFVKGKGIWISPVNIQRRFNANIQNFEVPSSGNDYPPQVDSRIMSLFGACWTAGSIKYLFESGIKGVTFFETVGERGIIQGDFQSRWPDAFPAPGRMIFPVFQVFRHILENKSYYIIKSSSSSPLKADLLVLSEGRLLKIILVNFSPDKRKVMLDFCDDLLNVSQLDAGSFTDAAGNPEWQGKIITVNSGSCLQLNPFSVNFIEGKLK